MADTESAVYKLVRSFTRGNTMPEAILYGYAKLLSMKEDSLAIMLDPEGLADLEKGRKLLAERSFDLNLLATQMQALIPYIRVTDKEQEAYRAFDRFMEGITPEVSSVQILEKACEASVIPLKEAFGKGASPDKRESWMQQMKQHTEEEGYHQVILSTDRKKEQKEPKRESGTTPESGKETLKQHWEEKSADRPASKEEGGPSGEVTAESLTELAERYRQMTVSLLDVVKGQDHAVFEFMRGCFQGDLFPAKEGSGHPRAYFFFFGPPGVGKTFLAEKAASLMGREFMSFSMSEYATPQSYEELTGIADFYKKARGGNLTEFVRKNPDGVLLFDEFEKAHESVQRLFLQILGSGKLSDKNAGKDVSFERATLIFTSNVGRKLYADRTLNLSTQPLPVIIDAIRSEKKQGDEPMLSPEICSRLAAGNLIMFDHLSLACLLQMTRSGFETFARQMEEVHRCRTDWTEELPLLFMYHNGNELDGRVASSQSVNFLKDEIHELIWQIDNRKTSPDQIKRIEFRIDEERMEPELKHLFRQKEKSRFLVFADEETIRQMDPEDPLCELLAAHDPEKAKKLLEEDLTGILIDPFYLPVEGASGEILSVEDYDTEGVRFFHKLADMQTDAPIYILDTKGQLSETDRESFLQEGAWGCLSSGSDREGALARQMAQLSHELYMEGEFRSFIRRGRVIAMKSRQEMDTESGSFRVVFYDLKDVPAPSAEDRKHLVSEAERPTVRFDDVIGAENAKEELRVFIDYLKNPKHFLANGGEPPKGLLLYGPPGTGKTMLAKAMAGESDASYFATNAAGFMDQWFGNTEQNIRDLFAAARRNAPSIIFIDEIDAIGTQRGGDGSNKAYDTALTELLHQMDGFAQDRKRPVFVMAATNANVAGSRGGYGKIDDALMRRFSSRINIDLPTGEERLTYLKRMTAKIENADLTEADLKNLADRTPAESLATLEAILNKARNQALSGKKLTGQLLLNTMEEFFHGEKKEYAPEYYRTTAYHETGHAVVCWLSGETPSYITIEARGDFGGYMQHANEEKMLTHTKEQLLGKIRTSLAGRAAELVFFGEKEGINTGASSDLQQATDRAFALLGRYGMQQDQLLVLTKEEMLSSANAGEYLRQANDLLNREMKKTMEMIEEHRDQITRVAEALLEKNHLTEEEFLEILAQDGTSSGDKK